MNCNIEEDSYYLIINGKIWEDTFTNECVGSFDYDMACVQENTKSTFIQDLKNIVNHFKSFFGKQHKQVIYTCITNDYDELLTPKLRYENFDYICFTDNLNIKSDVWKIQPIPYELKKYNPQQQSRGVKMLPHRYLKDYDLSVYVDGNISLDWDMLEYITSNIKNRDVSIFLKHHPNSNCTYGEMMTCAILKKDKPDIIFKQMSKYFNEGFPKNYGLSENNFIIRYHNKLDCIKLMEDWFNEFINGSKRDQLSLFYCIWKNKTNFKYLPTNINLIPKKHKNNVEKRLS